MNTLRLIDRCTHVISYYLYITRKSLDILIDEERHAHCFNGLSAVSKVVDHRRRSHWSWGIISDVQQAGSLSIRWQSQYVGYKISASTRKCIIILCNTTYNEPPYDSAKHRTRSPPHDAQNGCPDLYVCYDLLSWGH